MKSLPWRRVGDVILIIIKFSELLLWFSPRIIDALRSYIEQLKECFIRFPNTLKLVKKLGCSSLIFFNAILSVWISDETLFLMCDMLRSKLYEHEGNEESKIPEISPTKLVLVFVLVLGSKALYYLWPSYVNKILIIFFAQTWKISCLLWPLVVKSAVHSFSSTTW